MFGYRFCLFIILTSHLAIASVLQTPSNNNLIFNERKMLFEKKRCEKITVPMCHDLDYNLTSMPNQFNHETQQDAAIEAHQFWPLVEINCAKDLKFFLCSMYTPICIESYTNPVRACKSVCQRVRLGCERFMKQYGFDWPEFMNCDLFPEYGSTKEVCMDPVDANQQEKETRVTNEPEDVDQKTNGIETKTSHKLCNNGRENVENCIQPCYTSYFTDTERTFSYYWILTLAIICSTSSFITTITYLIEKSRFKYPEKPIIYLCICYLFVSIGYLLRYILDNDSVTCGTDGTRLQASNTSTSCAFVFILVYYFSMAGTIWWIMVCLTWFLAAGLKWGIESISKYNHYFHLIAWLIPTLVTVIILAMGLVDTDTVSGICSVGNSNVHNMRLFVITPAVVTLLIGIGFLLFGFVSLFRLRKIIKQQRHHQTQTTNTSKLENLMLRIGVFAVLYTVPTMCSIACSFYEQYYRIEWENLFLCRQQQQTGIFETDKQELTADHPCFVYLQNDKNQRPEFKIFMIKYFSSLVVGILSGFWIWTHKTLESWKYFLCFYCDRNEAKQVKAMNVYYKASVAAKKPVIGMGQPNIYQFPQTAVHQNHNDYDEDLNYYNITPPAIEQYSNNNCHVNKAAAFYYDCSSSSSTKTDRLMSSNSKYSMQSTSVSK